MAKAVLISLSTDIPDTEQGKDATVTVGTVNYLGKIEAIIVYSPPASPTSTKVTLEAVGLKTA